MDTESINKLYGSAQKFIDKLFNGAGGHAAFAETRFVVLDESEDNKLSTLYNSLSLYEKNNCKVMYINRENADRADEWTPAIEHQLLGVGDKKPNIILITEFRETALIENFIKRLNARFRTVAIGRAGAKLSNCVHLKIIRLIDTTYTEKDRKFIPQLAGILHKQFRIENDPNRVYFPECAVAHMLKENPSLLSRKLFLAGTIGQDHLGPGVDFFKAAEPELFKEDDYPWIDVSIEKGDKNRMLVFALLKNAIDKMRNAKDTTIKNNLKSIPFASLCESLSVCGGYGTDPSLINKKIIENQRYAPNPIGEWNEPEPVQNDDTKSALFNGLINLMWDGTAGNITDETTHTQNPNASQLMAEWFAISYCREHPLEEFIKLYYHKAAKLYNEQNPTSRNPLPGSANFITLMDDMYKIFNDKLSAMGNDQDDNLAPWAEVIKKYHSTLTKQYIEYIYGNAEYTLDDINEFLTDELNEHGIPPVGGAGGGIDPFGDIDIDPFADMPVIEQIVNYISSEDPNVYHNIAMNITAIKGMLQDLAARLVGIAGGPAFLDIHQMIGLGLVNCTTPFNYNFEQIAVNSYYLDSTRLFTFQGIDTEED